MALCVSVVLRVSHLHFYQPLKVRGGLHSIAPPPASEEANQLGVSVTAGSLVCVHWLHQCVYRLICVFVQMLVPRCCIMGEILILYYLAPLLK